MALAFKRILGVSFDIQIFEWLGLAETDTSPPHISIPHMSKVTLQLLAITGLPTVQLEGSLNLDSDGTKVWSLLNDVLGAEISLAGAGAIVFALESVNLIRPIITAGTTVTADIRIMGSQPARQ